MICPYCSHPENKVTDKRDAGNLTRRRRECLKCNKRFSTHEKIELNDIKVVKKNGSREIFDREKVRKGITRSCEKRPVDKIKIEKMINNIESKIRRKGEDVKSRLIGELVSKELKRVDKIAYIRFASVYREFTDLSDFKKEIKMLLKK